MVPPPPGESMRKLGVAVIGVGYWGRNHVRVLSEFPRAKLLAVCDTDEVRAREVAEAYGVPYFTDPADLLRREDVEAVTICTWSTVLAQVAKMALTAGKHVLVEKPMAASSREALELVRLAKEEGLTLAVGFIERFNPGVNFIRELISRGELGEVVALSSRRLSRWPRRAGDVGVLKDLAIHDVDLSRYLLGEEPEAVYARVGRLKRQDLDDYAFLMLSFPGGRVASIEANWLSPYKKRELMVTGSEAVATLNYLTQEVAIEREDGIFRPARRWIEPLRLELEHFVDCVLNNRQPLVSGLDGLVALRLCELALESSSKGEAIRVGDLLSP
ncbi:MAG TPA: Gfo/Idh/MocA family oxidoreductase [Candidatus Bathyarchaeota archaeon]|nr:Gfo/Idh/MocA family oxidoreductase [Candidatus Bathyarchaeota archaeon]